MLKIRYALLCAALVATAFQSLAAAPGDKVPPAEMEAKLIAVLKSDAPPAEKAITCKRLAVFGTNSAVPALAALLPDKELSSWARIALEAIPGPAADEALREAMGKLEGRLLIGTINSIAFRRDAKAVDGLVKRLKDADPDVATAAAVALGRIGNDRAATVLHETLKEGPAPLRGAAAQGLVMCADKLLTAGSDAEAAKLYDAVRKADVPKQRIREAVRGAILARKSAGVPLLVEQLKSEDKDLFGVGLSTARELGGPEVAKALIDELAKAAPPPAQKAPKAIAIKKAQYGAGDQWADVTGQIAAAVQNNVLSIEASNNLAGDPAQGKVKELRITYTLGGEEKSVVVPEGQTVQLGEPVAEGSPRQALLIYALGDLGQPAALPAVLEAARGGPWSTRLAAVRVLGQIGDARAVPVLLDAAKVPGGPGQAALESLSKLEGQTVDAAIAEGLAGAEGQTRAILIQIVGSRRIESAVPALLKDADSRDDQVRLAAVAALGMTVGPDRLGVLIGRLVKPQTEQDAEAAKNALFAACTRMADRNATAERLLAAMPGASAQGKTALLELLGAVGGEKALEGVAAAARGGDDAMRDAGSRILGEWMTPDAAPVLLDLAKTATDEKYKVRALRGYLRVARQMVVPLADRMAMCREALKLCQRDEERKLVLEAVRRYPSADGLALAVSLLDGPMKAEAGATAVAVGEKLVQRNPAAVAQAMKQVAEAGLPGETSARAKALLEQAERRGTR